MDNPCGIEGLDHVELVGPDPEKLHRLLIAFGFSRTRRHPGRGLDLYEQHDIRFLLRRAAGASRPTIASLGWRVWNADDAARIAEARGGRRIAGELGPAIAGLGGSRIELVDRWRDPRFWARHGFEPHPEPVSVAPKGFVAIDHLTNNVARGTLHAWSHFYRDVFGFTEVRYFDIRGLRTGLASHALRSPCGTFCIPINEGTDGARRSQIDEFLVEHGGPGIQHLAFRTDDLLASLALLDGTGIETLDIEEGYHDGALARVPGVVEDADELRRRKVLVDGDERGYLLQIFTRNLIGPIFIELIQRRNHAGFGEGNFGALFRSIERDQQRRGAI